MAISDHKTQLMRECNEAERILRDIVAQELSDEDSSCTDESPLKPWLVDQAQTVLIYKTKKTAFLYGKCKGHGIIIKRLKTNSEQLINWSPPIFVTITLNSGGFSFGRRTTSTFAVCTTNALQNSITTKKGHGIFGIDVSATIAGGHTKEQTDFLFGNFSGNIGTIGVSKVSGSFFDLSISGGSLQADIEKNSLYYGSNHSVADILNGIGIDPLPEFQPLYAELSRIVNTVEHPREGPSRMSASLERFSTGKNPDDVIVLPDGVVIREDLNELPKE